MNAKFYNLSYYDYYKVSENLLYKAVNKRMKHICQKHFLHIYKC